MQWMVPEKVLDLLCGWRNWVDKLSSDTLNLVLLYLVLTLWMEQNHCTLEDMETSVTLLIALFH